eukprot:gene32423-42007_t
MKFVKEKLSSAASKLSIAGYEVQTTRIAVNSFEEWLLPATKNGNVTVESVMELLISVLESLDINFFNIGPCMNVENASIVVKILSMSNKLSSSILFRMDPTTVAVPDYNKCKEAAKVCLQLSNNCGDLGNFRFCASFNCPPNIPFFPAAYHEELIHTTGGGELISKDEGRSAANGKRAAEPHVTLTVGLESGDLLFLAFHGVSGVAAGLENLLFPLGEKQFGDFGTLAAVSAVTAAVKRLSSASIRLVGYSGLMLPVMEDLTLAERAAQQPRARFLLRDLLTFSAVCGVGLDTVPIPGDSSADDIAGVYMEVAALAFRLNKPLSCRLLPMK